jgi:hypothetical protein
MSDTGRYYQTLTTKYTRYLYFQPTAYQPVKTCRHLLYLAGNVYFPLTLVDRRQ